MYWLTGSQHFGLMRGVRESLAGRVALLELLGFSAYELLKPTKVSPEGIFEQDFSTLAADPALSASYREPIDVFAAIIRGSLPRVALGDVQPADRRAFFSSYVQTYLERDVATFEGIRNLGAFATFTRLLAAVPASSSTSPSWRGDRGVAVNTIKQWTTVLEKSFHIYLLSPYYRSLNKRLVKTPKIYFLDSGLQAYLTGWNDPEQALRGPLAGQLFENWVIGNAIRSYRHRGLQKDLYFWRTRTRSGTRSLGRGKGDHHDGRSEAIRAQRRRHIPAPGCADPAPLRLGRQVLMSLSRSSPRIRLPEPGTCRTLYQLTYYHHWR